MRKLMLMALLATSAAMPAMAQDRGPDRHRDRGSQNDRSEARAERRSERAERREQAQRPERVERQRAVEPQQAVQQAQTEHRNWDRRREEGTTGVTREMRRQRSTAGDAQRVQVATEQQRQYRGSERRGERGILGQVIEQSRERQGQVVVRRDGDRDGRYQPRHSGSTRQWSNHWRNDRNYDWRHYRDRNRSIFRLGRYYDPYRYGYRRFSIGFSLFPSYYRSNYWLNDPWMYRLPPAYGPYRWVRYYDDALLVNIYTGQVVDVEYNFFW